MKSWFSKRRYLEFIIKTEIGKVKFKRQEIQRRGVIKVVPLVITYHLLLKSVGKIIQNHLYLLYKDYEFKNLFSPTLMVCFKSACKLSSYLIRANLYSLNRSVRSFKCKKPRCEVCLNVIQTDIFTSTVTRKT